MKERESLIGYKDVEKVIAFCMENRGATRSIDDLVSLAVKKLPNISEESVANIAISIEKALIRSYRPSSALDFQKEMEKMYGKLMSIVTSLENVDIKMAFREDSESKKLTALLKTMQISKDYLKLILAAQETFLKAQKINEFYDIVIETVAKFDPSKKEEFVKIINAKLVEKGK